MQPAHTQSIKDLIGNTPLVRVSHLDTGCCELYLKLESQNPGGSIKDRIARSMIERAEETGALKSGGIIVEATAGNTGLGLAFIAAMKGYKIILVVPDKMSREKIQHCKALGAEVYITRSDVNKGHPEYYQDMAQRIAKETGGYYIDQFANPANPEAHEKTTGPELWQQMNADIDAIICGVGSGGTLTGIGRFLRKKSATTKMILADPCGSILAPLVNDGRMTEAGSWLVEGIGEDFVPSILDMNLIESAYAISDEESFSTARDLLTKEGIFAGSSSGTLVAAALKYCREQKEPKRVVTFICDRGDKYLSKSFSNSWIKEQGFQKKKAITAADLLMRRHDQGDVVFVRPEDSLKTVYKRMRVADVSQMPVINGKDTMVGLITEKTLIQFLSKNEAPPIAEKIMTQHYVTVDPSQSVDQVCGLLLQNDVVVVASHGNTLSGLLTKVDAINHLLQINS